MAPGPDGLDLKEYVDSQLAEIRRAVDLARETVPKGIPWEQHVLAILAEKEKLFAEVQRRMDERGNAQDELARVVSASAKEAVQVANATAREQIARAELVATLQGNVLGEKIEALTKTVNLQAGVSTGSSLTFDRVITVVTVGALIAAVASGHLR